MKAEKPDPKSLLDRAPAAPGVYRMLDGEGTVLYVGKARNLRRRLASYLRPPARLDPKTRAMMGQMATIEFTVTHTEDEALLLENNLIKEYRPRYNVLLRDDKSYPWIHVSTDQPFPRLSFHRGARRGKGQYFGPYPSAGAVRTTLALLQKLFRVRLCEDSFFRNRSRPCLQYQIRRCTAPCVGLIGQAGYRQDVEDAMDFLRGRSEQVIEALVGRMEEAAGELEFERAARLRDQIAALRRVQERQYVTTGSGEVDVVACATAEGRACIGLYSIRGGRGLGHRAIFPSQGADASVPELISAFLSQHYLGRGSEPPPLILVQELPAERELLEQVFSERSGRRVRITRPLRGERRRWLDLARDNAAVSLAHRQSGSEALGRRLAALKELVGLERAIGRIECFDISHTRGEATVASCVVFGPEGAVKSAWRRFNIEGVAPGDDYAAMHQALSRRFRRLRDEEASLPDLLLIDGGAGQVGAACRALAELGTDGVQVLGVAKGPERRPGLETLILSQGEGREELRLPPDSPVLHLIQEIRDEAHRFAITGHRQRRGRARTRSALEDLPGIGPRRRQALLQRFGGLQGVARAGVEELSRTPGISRELARRIHDMFHDR
ncbi:MAG: excinuclease ABC subunit UvrC [Gammaproteobacteria bacterium]|nr:MAG: excinuclease ABC subunit UvrC [Gammaproteobacteria bacterium]